mmetsp:Transcript_1629/g.1756  ORF Transcript_1629/g.1756 Transcript_1629/m.1756 type:complete len:83 (+) Transcript_1629:28-276(+)
MKLTMKLTMSKSTTNTVQPPMRDNIEVELLKIHNIKPTVNSISISFFIIYRNRGRRSTTTAAATRVYDRSVVLNVSSDSSGR